MPHRMAHRVRSRGRSLATVDWPRMLARFVEALQQLVIVELGLTSRQLAVSCRRGKLESERGFDSVVVGQQVLDRGPSARGAARVGASPSAATAAANPSTALGRLGTALLLGFKGALLLLQPALVRSAGACACARS